MTVYSLYFLFFFSSGVVGGFLGVELPPWRALPVMARGTALTRGTPDKRETAYHQNISVNVAVPPKREPPKTVQTSTVKNSTSWRMGMGGFSFIVGQYFSISANPFLFAGSIPSELGKLARLKKLDFGGNQLTGEGFGQAQERILPMRRCNTC